MYNLSNNTEFDYISQSMYPIAPVWGYISLVIAVIFYGSNFIPVKQYHSGDGIFFQFIVCIGVWIVGFTVNCIRNFPKFFALPMIGGALWTTGNMNTVPVIQCIGLGLGMLLWANFGLIMGWANARFGWFGLKKQVPSDVIMNYVGVALALLSACSYIFIKSDVTTKRNETVKDDSIDEGQPNASDRLTLDKKTPNDDLKDDGFFSNLNPKLKRALGTAMGILAGLFYGFQFTPLTYVMNNYDNVSHNGLDYLFSMYTGIFVASTAYFIIYCLIKRNRPDVNPRIIFPGLISGMMWGVANCCVIIANSSVSQAVAFPISSSGPPIVSALYGVFLYKEIKGKKNYIILIVGFIVALTGLILCGLSK